MEKTTELQEYLQAYKLQYPLENEGIKIYESYLSRTATERLYARNNFDGHLTASCFIVDRQSMTCLMLYHGILKRWLQPGGHIDEHSDENILAAAYRECEEETGLTKSDLHLVHTSNDITIPFDIDSHLIPANTKKNEAEHYHHDIRYLFSCKNPDSITINPEESAAYKWVSFDEMEKQQGFLELTEKLRVALNDSLNDSSY